MTNHRSLKRCRQTSRHTPPRKEPNCRHQVFCSGLGSSDRSNGYVALYRLCFTICEQCEALACSLSCVSKILEPGHAVEWCSPTSCDRQSRQRGADYLRPAVSRTPDLHDQVHDVVACALSLCAVHVQGAPHCNNCVIASEISKRIHSATSIHHEHSEAIPRQDLCWASSSVS